MVSEICNRHALIWVLYGFALNTTNGVPLINKDLMGRTVIFVEISVCIPRMNFFSSVFQTSFTLMLASLLRTGLELRVLWQRFEKLTFKMGSNVNFA